MTAFEKEDVPVKENKKREKAVPHDPSFCTDCKSCVTLNGSSKCYKACIGNGTVPKSTGPRDLETADDGTVPCPDWCPYSKDVNFGSLLYEHTHPYGETCKGCIHCNTGERTMGANYCNSSIIFPVEGDGRPCVFRQEHRSDETIKRDLKGSVGPTVAKELVDIILAGINERNLTFWQTNDRCYNYFASMGSEPETWSLCHDFYLLFDWKAGVKVVIGRRPRGNKGSQMETAEISGIMHAEVSTDGDVLYLSDGTNRFNCRNRISILIAGADVPADEEDYCDDEEECEYCTVDHVTLKENPSQKSLSEWFV